MQWKTMYIQDHNFTFDFNQGVKTICEIYGYPYQVIPDLPKESKIQKVINNIGDEAILVKTKNWFQVYTTKPNGDHWVFGFAINDNIVEHFPIHQVNGRPVEEARQWLRHQKPLPEVVKICEQIIR